MDLHTDLAFSRLMLGTVQFGMSYGIANRQGQPTYEEARAILACAYEGGVNCLDTAASYGTSEEVIGRALEELGLKDHIIVVTKLRHLRHKELTQQEAEAEIEDSVLCSLRRLRQETLPVVLFHDVEDLRYIEALLKQKEKGRVRFIGFSLSSAQAALEIIASGYAEAVQIPTNLLDYRFTRRGVFREAKKRSVVVFVRSVYLQGLLLMPEENIPALLRGVIPARRKLQQLADEAGISLAELAVRYVLGIEGVTSALVGVETLEQMQQNLAYFAKGPLDTNFMQVISEAVPDLPETIINPTLWRH